jgi:ribonuclease D
VTLAAIGGRSFRIGSMSPLSALRLPCVHTPVYLDTPSVVDSFLASIGDVRILALDTEGASFHRFVDRIYLLQLSTRDRTAIIDPIPIGTPSRLGRLLEDPAVEIVFHDADYDLRLLHQDYGWHVRNIFDTRVAAQLLGLRAFGLAALLEKYFGVKLDKKHQRADWSMRPLTEGMLDYAAQDTIHLLELRDRLKHDLEKAGRWDWAAEEFALLEGTRWPEDDPANAFLRIKGARDLSRRELAVLRELVPWRDGVARQLDRATFRVVGNEQLLDISRLQPATRDALAAIKGMPRGIIESRGGEVLDAVKRGLAVPESALPRFPKAPRWDRDPEFDARVSALKTVRDAAATRLELDPGVLCSRDRMEAVARRNPASLDELESVSELRRWQRAVLGEGFVRALAPHRKKAPVAADDSPYKDS